MSSWLRRLALAFLLGTLVLAPVVAGKLWVWQSLLVALLGGLALMCWALGTLLTGPQPLPEPSGKRSQQPANAATEVTPPGGPAPDLLDWALVAFILWQVLSRFVSVYQFATDVYLARLLACAVVFWVLRYGLWRRAGEAPPEPPPGYWRSALWALVVGGGLLAVLGLREYVRTVFFLGETSWRVFGPMVNPNAAAGYLLIAIFPALGLLLGWQSRASVDAQTDRPLGAAASRERRSGRRDAGTGRGMRDAAETKRHTTPPVGAASSRESPAARPRYPEIAALFACLLMFATLLLTGSKAGLAAFVGGLVLFGVVGLSGKPRAQAAMIGLALLTVLVAFLLPPIRVRLLSAFGAQSHSTVFRLYTWQAAWHMLLARPWLGFGAGTFENVFPRFAIAGFTRAAHQSFLQLAAETGVPGLLLALAWGGLVLRRLLVLARSTQPLVKFVAAAALAALVASALQELFDYPWYVPGVAFSFFALAGLALAPDAGRGASVQRTKFRRWGANAPAWWGAAAILGLLLTLWSATNLAAEVVGLRGDVQAATMDYATASLSYEQASRLSPTQARFHVQVSKTEEAVAAGGDREALARAVQARLRAIKLQPTEPLNYLALARLYEGAGRLGDALAAAQAALRNYPNYPRGLAQLGQLQEQAGQHASALQTYRQLLALERGPVGRYPAVEGVPETAFARGWLAAGDEAARAGNGAGALVDYSHVSLILEQSINSQLATQEMTGGEMAGFGRLQEDKQMAEEVLGRLRGMELPLSLMRQAQLLLALREKQQAREALAGLAQRRVPVRDEVDWLAANWGMLRLAQELQKDEPKESARLALKATASPLVPSYPDALTRRGWLPADSASLKQLQQWAQTVVQTPLYAPREPL